ncbi:hypothetical protein ILUMI_26228 [Ignelater luminosus]|uniref:Integrase catalytic domain-containing protein n=1 Tax=Ignelater luminosus TaxID=2038154 RepID=A0A8K0CA55_IGNLU|nr:hypothetical protein ILUMI_26228 [Ignelater luminosus]
MEIQNVLNKENKESKEEKRIKREYTIRDSRLFRKDGDKLLAVPNTISMVTTKKLNEIIDLTEAPHRVTTDKGTTFMGLAFKKMCTERYIDHISNATSTVRVNGQVKRINRYITPDEDHKDWDKYVGKLQWGINNTIHQATKTTPFKLLFNYELRGVNDECIQKMLLEHQEATKDMMEKHERLDALKYFELEKGINLESSSNSNEEQEEDE